MLFKKQKPPLTFVSAVVVAAGSASRMAGIDKQQTELMNIPVVVRSVLAMSQSERIREIVLVCREEMLAHYYDLVRDYGLDKVGKVVTGGEQRQDSVFRGIAACDPAAEFYAIHDGARPLVSLPVIEDCIDGAIAHGAAAAGVRVKDTVKICDNEGMVISTPNRESLFAIQTPQIFAAELYKKAMERAISDRKYYTDDCQLIERMGKKVFVSRGSYDNVKITTPEDIALAQAIISLDGRLF